MDGCSYEDVSIDSEAIIVVCGVDEHGRRDVLAVEPMAEESLEPYKSVFNSLKERGLKTPRLCKQMTGIRLPEYPGKVAKYTLCGTSLRIFLRSRKNNCIRITVHLACT